ncbi:hypothetical protein ACS5PN_17335 [Roseateles sp. NT4]|uniref:hypothetical protein n=1 Tax=Roseateles sp. NT4 TaxID=3453715 RepID=UPI003EEEC5E4
MKVYTLVIAVPLIGCGAAQPTSSGAQEPVPSAATIASTPANLSLANSTLRLRTVPLPAPRSLEDKYVQLVLFVPTAGSVESLGNQESLLRVASANLLKFLWDRKQTLTVTAKPINMRSGSELPTVQLMQAKSENNSPVSKDLEPMVISPYTTEIDSDLTLKIQVARADSVNSGVASVAAHAFQLASSLASGGVLSRIAGKDYSAQAKKIDADIDKLLASGRVDPFLIAINPFTTQQLDVVASNGADEQFLFSVKLDAKDTLIGRGSGSLVFPTDPSDITKFKVAVTPAESTVRTAMTSSAASINAATADAAAFQVFCANAQAQLADLGLNRYDRAAVMYAYLLNSTWNRSVSVRPASDDEDRCVIATSDLASKTNLKLKSHSELERKTTDDRASWLSRVKQQLWSSALPLAMQTKKAEDWEKVLADPVSISVTGKPFKLVSTDEPIEPGGGFSISKEEAASALAASDLAFVKRSFCFALDSSSKASTFQTSCLQMTSDAAKSMKIEFMVSPSFDPAANAPPTISGVRFINN